MVRFLVLVAVAPVVIPVQLVRATPDGKMDAHGPDVRRAAQETPRDIDLRRTGFQPRFHRPGTAVGCWLPAVRRLPAV